MAVRVFGCNHVMLEVGDIKKAIEFYTDVFNLELKDDGEGDAFFQLGNHQFLALFEADQPHVDDHRHLGLIVRDDAQVAEVREKIGTGIRLENHSAISMRFSRPMGKSDSGG